MKSELTLAQINYGDAYATAANRHEKKTNQVLLCRKKISNVGMMTGGTCDDGKKKKKANID